MKKNMRKVLNKYGSNDMLIKQVIKGLKKHKPTAQQLRLIRKELRHVESDDIVYLIGYIAGIGIIFSTAMDPFSTELIGVFEELFF